MHQITLRVPEALANQIRIVATERGQSVNRFAETVLRAAVDPEFAEEGTERLRERLARAGLFEAATSAPARRPPPHEVERARAEAGRGKPLSEYVGEGRR